MKITEARLRKVIRQTIVEQISTSASAGNVRTGASVGDGGLGVQTGGDAAPRIIVVDWDDDGAGLSPLVELHPDAVQDWNLIAATEGEEAANSAVTEMLTDETGYLVNGWRWQ